MNLIELLNTGHYDHNSTMIELQNLLGESMDQLYSDADTALKQLVLDTCNELLSRREAILGLPVNPSKSSLMRRESIKAKLSTVGTATKTMITNVVKSYGNGEITITEDIQNYKLLITFTSQVGVPANIASLKADVDRIRPAHLAVEYNYLYNSWQMLICDERTWGYYTSIDKTWGEIREYGGEA